jgi:TatD DNase family protein
MQELVGMEGIYIGINGCSLKTEENLSVVAQIPMDKLMLETDAPWCGLRPSHASSAHVKTAIQAKDKRKHDIESQVKGRNEPCNICQVCEVVASVKGLSVEDVSAKAYANTMNLFFT